jgi:hypothetical protein
MANRDLQRLTTSVDYIGHGQSLCRSLPTRRHHITQKVRIDGQRTRYIGVHTALLNLKATHLKNNQVLGASCMVGIG